MKNLLEKVLFILMNIFGPPVIQIVSGIIWGWIAVVISTMLFFVFFVLWRHVSKNKGHLIFNPKWINTYRKNE